MKNFFNFNGTTKVSISGTNASTTIRASQYFRLVSDTDCFINVGAAATTSKGYLPANTIETIFVGSSTTIQCITAGATGSLYITPLI